MNTTDNAGGQGTITAPQDGIRQTPGDGRSEVWHFDASLDDGTTLAIGFCLVGADTSDPTVFETVVNLMLTRPDGHHEVHAIPGTVRAEDVGSTRCALPFGANTAEGDLRFYTVHVETDDQDVILDLQYEAHTEAYQPRIASPITLGENDQVHFADLILPRCAVTGTVSMGGMTTEVVGEGAHDHQWFDSNPLTTWHHWLWGHAATEHYSIVLFDLVSSEELSLERIPIFGVFDASGRLTFDNESPATITTELALEPTSGKSYPRKSSYLFTDNDRAFELLIEQTATLVSEHMYTTSDDDTGNGQQVQFDKLGIQPSYGRFRADATLLITEQGKSISESGAMIYEFNYPAKADPEVLSSAP